MSQKTDPTQDLGSEGAETSASRTRANTKRKVQVPDSLPVGDEPRTRRKAKKLSGAYFLDDEAVESTISEDEEEEEESADSNELIDEIEEERFKRYVMTIEDFVPYANMPSEVEGYDDNLPTKVYKAFLKGGDGVSLWAYNGPNGYLKIRRAIGMAVLQEIVIFLPGIRELYKKINLVSEVYALIREGKKPPSLKINLVKDGNITLYVSYKYKGIFITNWHEVDCRINLARTAASGFADFFNKEMPDIFPELVNIQQIQM